MPQITKIHYNEHRIPPFKIDRPNGYPEYSFAHFIDGIYTYIDGVRVFLPPHSCIIWRPGTPQYFESDKPICHNWFHFKGNPEPLFQELGLPIDQWICPKQWFFISEIIEEMQDEFFSEKAGRTTLVHLKAKEFFIKLSRALQDTPDDSTAELIRRLRSRMLSRPEQAWSVEQLADKANLSPSRFHALYHTMYGNGPIDDLIRFRINIAKYDLETTSLPISSIAEKLGYRNITHFSRQFKKIVGTAPQQYRKNDLLKKTSML